MQILESKSFFNSEERTEGVHKFETTPAVVSVLMSRTTNLGNYNSKKIAVSLQVPCYKENIDKTYQEIVKWLDERLSES